MAAVEELRPLMAVLAAVGDLPNQSSPLREARVLLLKLEVAVLAVLPLVVAQGAMAAEAEQS